MCNFNFFKVAKGCSENPCHPYFRGPSPISEEESKVFDAFLRKKQFTAMVNYLRYALFSLQ